MADLLDLLTAAPFWVAVLRIATPLILGTLGVLLCERAGVLNLGIEGIMVAGAFTGWLAVYLGAPLWVGVGAAALGSAVAGRWSRLSTDKPGAWMIAVGRAAPPEAQVKKITELNRLGIAFEAVKAASGADETLSLGQFDTLAAAQEALTRFAARGIHTGHIVEMAPPSTSHRLRIDAATPQEAATLESLSLSTPGKAFTACAQP